MGEAINVGTNHYHSVKEIAEKISNRLSAQILNVQSRQGEIPRSLSRCRDTHRGGGASCLLAEGWRGPPAANAGGGGSR